MHRIKGFVRLGAARFVDGSKFARGHILDQVYYFLSGGISGLMRPYFKLRLRSLFSRVEF